MKKRKFSLNFLWYNNKVLFIVAVLISLSVWVFMSMGSSNDTTVTITNIPIQIELSEDAAKNGLQIFSGGDQKASVTISGNRAIVGSVTAAEINVTASAAEIDKSGQYQLSVSASKKNPSILFDISQGVTPSYVDVFVDYLRETTFQIQDNVVYKVADGYYASTALSADSIVISGPQTEISKIGKVSAVGELSGTIKSNSETNCKIVIYDHNGNEMSTDLLSMDIKSVDAKISVLPEKTVKVVPSFINKPKGLEITDDMISINPSTITLAGTKEVLDKTDSVKLESIDFITLKDQKASFDKIGIDIPSDSKNISNSSTAEFTLDLSGLKSKTFTVSSFDVEGLSAKYKADITQKSISVEIIGTESQIEDLTEDKITAVIDTKDFNGTLGSVQMPVNIKISGADACWAYGSYKANLTISEA